jgi:hypothetical protein
MIPKVKKIMQKGKNIKVRICLGIEPARVGDTGLGDSGSGKHVPKENIGNSTVYPKEERDVRLYGAVIGGTPSKIPL